MNAGAFRDGVVVVDPEPVRAAAVADAVGLGRDVHVRSVSELAEAGLRADIAPVILVAGSTTTSAIPSAPTIVRHCPNATVAVYCTFEELDTAYAAVAVDALAGVPLDVYRLTEDLLARLLAGVDGEVRLRVGPSRASSALAWLQAVTGVFRAVARWDGAPPGRPDVGTLEGLLRLFGHWRAVAEAGSVFSFEGRSTLAQLNEVIGAGEYTARLADRDLLALGVARPGPAGRIFEEELLEAVIHAFNRTAPTTAERLAKLATLLQERSGRS